METNKTAAKPVVVTRKEVRSRKKTFRVPLTVAGPGFAQTPMDADQLKVWPDQALALHSLQFGHTVSHGQS